MNLKKTFMLGLILAISGFFLYLNEFASDKEPRSFLSSDTASLTGIEVKRHNEIFRFIAKAGQLNSWAIEGLEYSPLDSDKVDTLLEALKHFKPGEAILSSDDLEIDPEPLGLKNPEVTLSLYSKEKSERVLFGGYNDFLGKRYIKLEPMNQVYLTSDEQLYSLVNNSRDFFRSDKPVKFSDIEVRTLRIHSDQDEIEVIADEVEKLKWHISKPDFFRASEEKISEFMTGLRSLRSFKFFEPEEGFNQGKRLLKVVLEFKPEIQREALEISFYRHEDDSVVFAVTGRDEYFQMMRDPEELFKPSVNDLRVKRFIDFDPSRITRADYSGTLAENISLRKVSDGWLVNEKPGDALFVEQVIDNLLELEASAYPEASDKEFGFEKPTFELALYSENMLSIRLLVGRQVPGKNEFYAKLQDNSEVFIITAHSLRRISPREEALLIQPDYQDQDVP